MLQMLGRVVTFGPMLTNFAYLCRDLAKFGAAMTRVDRTCAESGGEDGAGDGPALAATWAWRREQQRLLRIAGLGNPGHIAAAWDVGSRRANRTEPMSGVGPQLQLPTNLPAVDQVRPTLIQIRPKLAPRSGRIPASIVKLVQKNGPIPKKLAEIGRHMCWAAPMACKLDHDREMNKSEIQKYKSTIQKSTQ